MVLQNPVLSVHDILQIEIEERGNGAGIFGGGVVIDEKALSRAQKRNSLKGRRSLLQSPQQSQDEDHVAIEQTNPWLNYVGDCKGVDNFLASKDGWGWIFPKFLNALFRGVGQVVFCNNPFSGLVILCALFLASLEVGLATTLAASTAILTAFIFRQDMSAINAGLTTYNAVLVGSVTAALWTPLYKQELTLTMWAFIVLGSALSVFVNTALSNLLSAFKLPSLTFPFNIVTLLIFVCLMPTPIPTTPGPGTPVVMNGTVAMGLVQELPLPELNNTVVRAEREAAAADLNNNLNISAVEGTDGVTAEKSEDKNALHWGSAFKGVLLSMGQVYGVNDLIASMLMYIATFMYSPTIFMMSFVGATLSTIFGLIFTDAPYGMIYDGIWGFNGILSATAIGGFFFVLTCHSFGTALANVLLTVMIQHALTLALGPNHIPCFTLPFVLSSFMFLQMSASGDNLSRVTAISSPEMHRYHYLENQRLSRPAQEGQRDTTDEIAEEKELVLKEVKVIMEETPKEAEEKKTQEEEEKK